MDALCQELRRYTVFRLLLDESEDAFFSVIREVTGQFSLFPPEKHKPPEDKQIERLRVAAEKFFALNEADAAPEEDGLWRPFDLFRPSEADAEMGEAFYYEMFRVLGETEGTWDTYKKHIDRYSFLYWRYMNWCWLWSCGNFFGLLRLRYINRLFLWYYAFFDFWHLRNFGLCGGYSGRSRSCGRFLEMSDLWPHSGTQGQTGGECCGDDGLFLHFASSFPDMERTPNLFAVQREIERSFRIDSVLWRDSMPAQIQR